MFKSKLQEVIQVCEALFREVVVTELKKLDGQFEEISQNFEAVTGKIKKRLGECQA